MKLKNIPWLIQSKLPAFLIQLYPLTLLQFYAFGNFNYVPGGVLYHDLFTSYGNMTYVVDRGCLL